MFLVKSTLPPRRETYRAAGALLLFLPGGTTFAAMLRGSCVSHSPLSYEIVLFADEHRKTHIKNAIFSQPLERERNAMIVRVAFAPLR